MVNINYSEIETSQFMLTDIIDIAFDDDHIFLLENKHQVNIIDYNGIHQYSITLANVNHQPSYIHVDSLYLYIGYENGTVEVIDKNTTYEKIKITSPNDAGGPGNPKINTIMATSNYLLVNTVENGLLIYLQPSILFYKWIMIELETSILSFSYDQQLLFVLVKDGSIHYLDFQLQRLEEIPIGGYSYIDLEYRNGFLYLATKQFLHIYDISDSYKLIYSYKEMENKILRITVKENYILILLNNGKLRVIGMHNKNEKLNFKVSDSIYINEAFSINSFENVKYSIVDIHKDKNVNEFKIIYLENRNLVKLKIDLI